MAIKASRRDFLLTGAATAASLACGQALAASTRLPNIVVIYADDLGYGDLSCYGAARIQTPNIDRLAQDGVRFTNGHSPSATCTPSRYALLTGEYAWRRDGAQILPGDAPALIEPGRFTLPAMLQGARYRTAVIGKWHLGLGDGRLDWNGEIRPGPLDIGFDEGFFIPATMDRVPTVFVENRRVAGLDPADPIRVSYAGPVGDEPTARERPDLARVASDPEHSDTIVNGIGRIGHMSGGRAARWVDEDVTDILVARSEAFMAANRERPFFLYFAANEPHVPRAPHARFAGRSGMGPRGDAILSLDWAVGRIVDTIERLGLTQDTLIVFSSDNGPILDDGYADGAVEGARGHSPAGPFRSGKYSIYEGGTRVPLVVRWPGRAARGAVSDALVDHVDLLASFARLTGRALPSNAAPDSFDMLEALLGRARQGRSHVVEDTKLMVQEMGKVSSSGPRVLALVEGDWKFVRPSAPPHQFHGNVIGTSEQPQLFNLARDPGETQDLARVEHVRAATMARRLDAIVAAGRSRP